MAAQAGKEIYIQVNTTGSTYVNLGGLRTKSLKVGSEPIDITHSDSTNLWRERLGTSGVKSLDVTCEGAFIDDAAVNKVVANLMTTTQTYNSTLIIPGLGTFTGVVSYDSIEFSGSYNGEVSYNVAISSAGAMSFVAS